MKRANRLLITIICICAICTVLSTAYYSRARPVYAQQSTNVYDDGTFYITSSVDVDSNYNLYLDSYMEVEFDDYEDLDGIEVVAYADQDGQLIYSDYGDGDDWDPAEVALQSNAPVATGHEYGLESDGYACFDDGEDDCDPEYVGSAYASVNVSAPLPQITSISPPSVNQGAQGILTINGSNLVENSGDQLTINFSGGGSPFALASAASSNMASFSYDFSGYPAGTYTLSVTNNEGTSNSEPFAVVQNTPSAPPADPCAVTSSPQVGFTSIVPAATPGGSGAIGVSFSGTAFSAVTASVTYGPQSTPESIAANLAAQVTRMYFNKGLSAKAFGSNVVYSGNTNLGTVSNIATGPSYGNDGSAGAAASAACYAAQPSHYYRLEYKAYIPVDNIPGPTPCNPFLDPSESPGLDYLGDVSSFSATGYRILETAYASINLLSSAPQGPVVPLTGKTVNFATPLYTFIGGGPLATISGGQWLEPTPKSMTAVPGTFSWEHGCNASFENEFGFANTTGIGGATTTFTASKITTEFTGLKNDPLEPQVPGVGINWDLSITIDSSSNTATVTGWNTCYPAQQIRVNGVLIYDSQPLNNTTTYLGACLTHVNSVRNVNNCTNIPLNTSRPCTPQ